MENDPGYQVTLILFMRDPRSEHNKHLTIWSMVIYTIYFHYVGCIDLSRQIASISTII
jgi:hypothetical protein